MPNCYVATGARKTRWVPGTRNHHPSGGAHGLGILTCLLLEGKWQAESLFGSKRCQQSHQERSLQDSHCWRDHTSTGRKQEVHQGWWNLIISLHSPWLWIIPSHHIQHTMGKVQICTPPLGPIMCPGYLPKDDGPDTGMVQGSYWNCWWCCHLWRWWWRSWPEPTQLHVQSPRTWSCVQWREVWSQEGLSNILWNGIWCQWSHPDPKKVDAIHKMPPPDSKLQLQHFLGMVTYLSPFIPSLSTHTAPLWELLKKDSEFMWNPTYQEAFNQIKKLVCKDTTLQYFDVQKPVTVQVDASKKGLGAALLQEGCPVAFASKALTPTEQWYANIECEMLACIFRAEQFHMYVFGHAFTIESDHKPLEQINLKNLADTPARLQWMLLRLQNYDVTIKYSPGKEMLVADALSRYSPLIGPEVALDIAIHHVHIMPEKKLEFQRTIQDDPLLHTLADTIVAGWPEDIKDIPKALCPYHNHHDVMTVEDGLILKGEALIIPPLEREKILHAIHEGHMGITKCQYHARQCVYWPGINEDIRKMVEACPTCQCHCPQEPRQPLQPTPAPECPWQHIGADFFTFDGFEYLVIIDYYTKMPFIRKIPPSQCNAAKTISVLKELFSEHGIPETIQIWQWPTICQPSIHWVR